MRITQEQRVYKDIRVYNLVTENQEQSIIPVTQMDKVIEDIGAISLKPSKSCEISFVWSDERRNKEKKYPKVLEENKLYSFEDIDFIKDVIFKGEIGTEFKIAIGV